MDSSMNNKNIEHAEERQRKLGAHLKWAISNKNFTPKSQKNIKNV